MKYVFEVSFKRNSFTTTERVKNFSLLRSAEVALENGYPYFVVIEQSQPVTVFTESMPLGFTSMSSYSAHGRHDRTASGGRKEYISNPITKTLIACFSEKPKSVISYDAENIVKYIKSKYEIQTESNKI